MRWLVGRVFVLVLHAIGGEVALPIPLWQKIGAFAQEASFLLVVLGAVCRWPSWTLVVGAFFCMVAAQLHETASEMLALLEGMADRGDGKP